MQVEVQVEVKVEVKVEEQPRAEASFKELLRVELRCLPHYLRILKVDKPSTCSLELELEFTLGVVA